MSLELVEAACGCGKVLLLGLGSLDSSISGKWLGTLACPPHMLRRFLCNSPGPGGCSLRFFGGIFVLYTKWVLGYRTSVVTNCATALWLWHVLLCNVCIVHGHWRLCLAAWHHRLVIVSRAGPWAWGCRFWLYLKYESKQLQTVNAKCQVYMTTDFYTSVSDHGYY